MTDNAIIAPVKKGGFVKGVSGNPAGRPKNTKNAITLHKIALEGELRARLKGDMYAVVDKCVELALAGDQAMIKLLIDKVIPTSRASEDDAPQKERIQIVISQLADSRQPITVTGTTLEGEQT
jgi:hypothetical protein